MNDKRFGFTLAEVLITLGIIGVVAAMTIPTLINNYQKNTVVTQLRKSYSVFQQAYGMAQVNNGNPTDWVPASPSYSRANIISFWQTYMLPSLKVAKICDSADGSDFYNCWSNEIKGLNGTLGSTDINTSQGFSFILADGTNVQVSDSDTYGAIYVDLNGKSKPNVIGKDVFRMDMYYNGNSGLHLDGFTRTRDELLNATPPNAINACNKASWGTGCAFVIQVDGWTIKDDYPW